MNISVQTDRLSFVHTDGQGLKKTIKCAVNRKIWANKILKKSNMDNSTSSIDELIKYIDE